MDHVEGELSVAAPPHLIPSGEEVAWALGDVVVDTAERLKPGQISETGGN
jgi:hypothetical protein